MTELETKDYQLRAFMQNLNSIYLYNEFIKAIKSKDNKAIEESRAPPHKSHRLENVNE